MKSSYFDGTLWGFIGNRFLAWLITILTLGIAAPWAFCMRKQWELEHTVVNNRRMKFTGNAAGAIGVWILYLICSYVALLLAAYFCNAMVSVSRDAGIAACLIVLLCVLIYVPFTKIQIMKWIAKYTVFDSKGAKSIEDGEFIKQESYSVSPKDEVRTVSKENKTSSGSLILLVSGIVVSVLGCVALFFSFWGFLPVGIGLIILSVEYSK